MSSPGTSPPPPQPYPVPPNPALLLPLPPTTPESYTELSNAFLHDLRLAHTTHLHTGDDTALRAVTNAAHTVRRAAEVYNAAATISALPLNGPSASARNNSTASSDIEDPNAPPTSEAATSERLYLQRLVIRLQNALQVRDLPRLESLSRAAEGVLDSLLRDTPHDAFRPIRPPRDASDPSLSVTGFPDPISGTRQVDDRFVRFDSELDPTPQPDLAKSKSFFGRTRTLFSRRNPPDGKRDPDSAALQHRMHICGLSLNGLTKRDKLVLWLYLLMVLGAIIAVTAVTVDFVRRQVNPDSFIRSDEVDSLEAPVVTVCLSQTGVPFSRLQLFNFTDAEGNNLQGADPQGPQTERQSDEFRNAVDRFWDNPDNEDCDRVAGDFYPFPLRSLNRLVSGESSTKCRQCFRVGRKQPAIATSTDFRNSSILSFFTDNYFLQCSRRAGGLNEDSLDFLHAQINASRDRMESLEVLFSDDDQPNVSDLEIDAFTSITSEQACNIFYFAFFPKALGRTTTEVEGPVDVRYTYNGTAWLESGEGPYFRIRNEAVEEFLPAEALQLFVSTRRATRIDDIGVNRDMILIGPNTQTFATFRPVIVYGTDRYDTSSSTSNFQEDDVRPLFGYWLVYRIFYNYNRFVIDEWYRDSTYPVSQWLVDFTGYASLFTGASLFSLLLLPLLRGMQRREKQRLRAKNPEVYVWSKHRSRYHAKDAETEFRGAPSGDRLGRRESVMLPGYNL